MGYTYHVLFIDIEFSFQVEAKLLVTSIAPDPIQGFGFEFQLTNK